MRTTYKSFALRATAWPPPGRTIPAPPADWARPWAEFAREYSLEWQQIAGAHAAFSAFWVPVAQSPRQAGAWDPARWLWQ